MSDKPSPLCLLAPARNVDVARVAIRCGADAIYIGGPHHGARAAATNSIEEIAELCRYAHQFRVRVYVTLNTIIYDNELADVEKVIRQAYEAGVDALIVQDLGILRLNIPPIALHASTQCNANTPERAKFLADLGMNCIVVPREFTLDEIRAVRRAVAVPLEGFVHGALCVSYSGDCRASFVNGHRSANRGECAQICRMPYDLTDNKGNVLVRNQHLLSLKDLNRLTHLTEMAEAGISIFKIEGRLKNEDYVASVVTAYSQALDTICRNNPERWTRASAGQVQEAPQVDLTKVFNREYTPYFLHQNNNKQKLGVLRASTPKFVGPYVAVAEKSDGLRLRVKAIEKINNGDGLGFFDANGTYTGFRANRVENNIIHLTAPINIGAGTKIYRNSDKAYLDALHSARTRRVIDVDAILEARQNDVMLTLSDVRGCRITSVISFEAEKAEKPQGQRHHDAVGKLGDTIYRLREFDDRCADRFIPASVLNALRRRAVADLDVAADATYVYEKRRPEQPCTWPESEVTFRDNISNRLADKVYRDHGVEQTTPAIEVKMSDDADEILVMTTRHCIRGALGACLRTPDATKLPSGLFLRNPSLTTGPLRLSFDCANCRMEIYAPVDRK